MGNRPKVTRAAYGVLCAAKNGCGVRSKYLRTPALIGKLAPRHSKGSGALPPVNYLGHRLFDR